MNKTKRGHHLQDTDVKQTFMVFRAYTGHMQHEWGMCAAYKQAILAQQDQLGRRINMFYFDIGENCMFIFMTTNGCWNLELIVIT